MQGETLIKMANQIAAFFAPMPDREAAIEALAQHLKRFWNPRMRQALVAAIDTGDVDDLHELVRTAVDRYRTLLIG